MGVATVVRSSERKIAWSLSENVRAAQHVCFVQRN